MIFQYFSRQIYFSRTFQEIPLNSSTFQACANPAFIPTFLFLSSFQTVQSGSTLFATKASEIQQLMTKQMTLLPCQPRVTVTSCFVYKVIRDLESIDHLCINPIRLTDLHLLKLSIQVMFNLTVVNKYYVTITLGWQDSKMLTFLPTG